MELVLFVAKVMAFCSTVCLDGMLLARGGASIGNGGT